MLKVSDADVVLSAIRTLHTVCTCDAQESGQPYVHPSGAAVCASLGLVDVADELQYSSSNAEVQNLARRLCDKILGDDDDDGDDDESRGRVGAVGFDIGISSVGGGGGAGGATVTGLTGAESSGGAGGGLGGLGRGSFLNRPSWMTS